ncbi:helix-turn-helix domain-containing protein [Gordonia bronchialis]|uniref:helix-turn-helix domain-containing protein n=1 Tax=Gordonia bronchialis TaxID=2054 RepID=UPI000E1BC6F4|nr:helix-turn-helix domain-containing protein [Gordonia bronchialis]QGS25544.1 helix-turn-helix domain-containing protein [Gordonia bronchialis]
MARVDRAGGADQSGCRRTGLDLNAGESVAALAREFGISRQSVYNYAKAVTPA